jgi:hypothetical protein
VIEAGALISIKAPGQPRRPLAFGHLTGSGKPYVASVNPENARTMTTPSSLNNVITIDDERIRNHLDRIVRGSVEETLNALLDAEADRLCNAQRYERIEARRDTRAGHYERNLQTKAGEVRLRIPKLRRQTFETAIIERYRRRESSVEEALIEMHLAGVSVRRVEDITEALWGTRVSPSTVSRRSRPGAIGRSRAGIRTSTSMASYSSAAGPVKYAMSRCWWRSASTARVIGRFLASVRVRRKRHRTHRMPLPRAAPSTM